MHDATYNPSVLSLPTFVMSPTDCPGAAVSLTFVQTPGNLAYDSNYIKTTSGYAVDTQNNAYIGLKPHAWVATVPSSATLIGTSSSSNISITIIGCLTIPMTPSPAGPGSFVYEINPTALTAQTYTLPSYASPPCGYSYSISIVRTDAAGPIPFSWSATSSQISFAGTTATSSVGVTTFRIDAT